MVGLRRSASRHVGNPRGASCLAMMAGFITFNRTRASTSNIDHYRLARRPCRVRCRMGSNSLSKFETRRTRRDGQLGGRTACESALRCVCVLKTAARRVFRAGACLSRAGWNSISRLRGAGHGAIARRSRGSLGKCGVACRWRANRERNEPIFCFKNGVGKSAARAVTL